MFIIRKFDPKIKARHDNSQQNFGYGSQSWELEIILLMKSIVLYLNSNILW